MSQLDTECLKLNKNWVPIGVISVRQAFKDAMAGTDKRDEGAVTLLRLVDGYPIACKIEDWMKFAASADEDYITVKGTFHGESRRICVPRVCITVSYDKLRLKEQPCTRDNLLKRYGHKDAVTNKKLKKEDFSREHVVPRSKGGRDGWENEVPMHRRLNSSRGNKAYEEVGLKRPRILPAPKPLLPINVIRNKYGYKEWDFFAIPR